MKQRFLLQILLLAQHVSGTTMPIIRNSRVLYSVCCLWYFVLWFSSCWSGVELRVMCPVCRMLQHPSKSYLGRFSLRTLWYPSPITFPILTHILWDWDSVAGTATQYGQDCPGFEPRWRTEIFSSQYPPKLSLGFTQPPLLWIPSLFPGSTAARACINHPSSSSDGVENGYSFIQGVPEGM